MADVIVVHKADLPQAPKVEAQLRAMLELSGKDVPPIVRVSSQKGEGLSQLCEVLLQMPRRREQGVQEDQLLRALQQILARRFQSEKKKSNSDVALLIQQWQSKAISTEQAASQLGTMLFSIDRGQGKEKAQEG